MSNNENPSTRDYRQDSSRIKADALKPARWFHQLVTTRVENDSDTDVDTPRGRTPQYEFTALPSALQSASGDYQLNLEKQSRINEETVECLLCPQKCRIAPNHTGMCQARVNRGGKLYAQTYGLISSLALDPIEKKPLFHFLPATSVLSLGSFGCNLTCKFCQNWQISQTRGLTFPSGRAVSPQQIVSVAKREKAPSVAFTYNEPTINAEYVVDVAKECQRAGIRTVAVSNGMIGTAAREEFYDVMNAVNIDLKAFSQDFYQRLTGGALQPVLDAIQYVAKQTSVWLEITNLVIPQYNDSDDDFKRLVDWLLKNIGDQTPLHLSAFFPTWKLTNVPRTPPATLARAARIAQTLGVKFVYGGNIDDTTIQSTFCPQCKAPIIERDAKYRAKVTDNLCKEAEISNVTRRVQSNSTRPSSFCCRICGQSIPGVFE
ncbi:MAG: AmmeMemoRadiSam system radical SAM enzyme [Planctomycetia bacterium]|nr:AmmeMemoRadiSam system radical SAM enzyme [Planctomycetia bacterium]